MSKEIQPTYPKIIGSLYTNKKMNALEYMGEINSPQAKEYINFLGEYILMQMEVSSPSKNSLELSQTIDNLNSLIESGSSEANKLSTYYEKLKQNNAIVRELEEKMSTLSSQVISTSQTFKSNYLKWHELLPSKIKEHFKLNEDWNKISDISMSEIMNLYTDDQYPIEVYLIARYVGGQYSLEQINTFLKDLIQNDYKVTDFKNLSTDLKQIEEQARSVNELLENIDAEMKEFIVEIALENDNIDPEKLIPTFKNTPGKTD